MAEPNPNLCACSYILTMQGLVTYVSKVEMEVASIRVKAATIFLCLCRCYEVQCASGTVIGNYSQTAGTNISLPLNLTIANPPYMFPLNNSTKGQYPVDDNGTAFPGNNGTAQNVLDVQCYSQNTSTSVSHCLADFCKHLLLHADLSGARCFGFSQSLTWL